MKYALINLGMDQDEGLIVTISRIHRLVFKHAQLLRDCCSVIRRDTFFLIIMYWAALTV